MSRGILGGGKAGSAVKGGRRAEEEAEGGMKGLGAWI